MAARQKGRPTRSAGARGEKGRLEREKQEIRKLEEARAEHKREMEEVEADKAAKAAKVDELRREIRALEASADGTSLVKVSEMKAELEAAKRAKEAAEARLDDVLHREVDESALVRIQDRLQSIEGQIQQNHDEEMLVLRRIEEKTDQLAVQLGRTVRTLTFLAEGETDVPQLVVSTPLLADPDAPRPMFSRSASLYFVCAYDGSNDAGASGGGRAGLRERGAHRHRAVPQDEPWRRRDDRQAHAGGGRRDGGAERRRCRRARDARARGAGGQCRCWSGTRRRRRSRTCCAAAGVQPVRRRVGAVASKGLGLFKKVLA